MVYLLGFYSYMPLWPRTLVTMSTFINLPVIKGDKHFRIYNINSWDSRYNLHHVFMICCETFLTLKSIMYSKSIDSLT